MDRHTLFGPLFHPPLHYLLRGHLRRVAHDLSRPTQYPFHPMLVTDGNGLPVGFHLVSANHHEVKLAVPTLQTVRVPRKRGGRPKQRPKELVADRAYYSKRFRKWLRSKSIKATIPPYERRERKRP
jgi:hypothetical protein